GSSRADCYEKYTGTGAAARAFPRTNPTRKMIEPRFSELNRSHIRCRWDIHLTGRGRFRRICGLFCGKRERNLEFWTK
ncbi:MAG: hypothetical protein LUG25_03125, partial [Oscillospiraceae bacterium]|nr:hypothetical protein [Oscillospiraceae bacterium]